MDRQPPMTQRNRRTSYNCLWHQVEVWKTFANARQWNSPN